MIEDFDLDILNILHNVQQLEALTQQLQDFDNGVDHDELDYRNSVTFHANAAHDLEAIAAEQKNIERLSGDVVFDIMTVNEAMMLYITCRALLNTYTFRKHDAMTSDQVEARDALYYNAAAVQDTLAEAQSIVQQTDDREQR